MAVIKVNRNKLLIIIVLAALTIIIGIQAINKVNKHHYQKLYDSTIAKINEQALKCYRKKDCLDTTITLNQLYTKKYLTTMSNPKTNEIFNEESYVTINHNQASFTIVNE